jgi:HAD superfamily phosphatase (TIGR01668 family)
MFASLLPTYHAASLYEVEPRFFFHIGVKTLLIDLDNTLGSYRDAHPRPDAVAYIERLREYDYDIIIISNNHGPRVATYADNLGLDHLSSARKPFRKKLAKFLLDRGADLHKTMLVGDQLLTDVLGAKRLGIRVLLTDPLVKEDQWTTRFNRLIDRPIRRYFKKRYKLKNWRNAHDRDQTD